MVAKPAHRLEDFAQAFVVADVVADQVGGAHRLLRRELSQAVVAAITQTEWRGYGLIELQAKSVSRTRRVILAIAPELHPLKQSTRPCQHRYTSRLLEPVVPAFAAYLIGQELRILSATLAPMPPRAKGCGAEYRSEEHTSELQSLRHLV